MIRILAYPLTIVYFICFGLTLVVFHPIQWICLNIFGYKAHKISVDWLQFFIMRSLNVLGTRFSFNNSHKTDITKPLIIVANHQSMYDIPPLIWYLKQHHVKFISKKELGKGIPSVSFNLRHGGSALIDRKNPNQAIKEIKRFSNYIKDNNYAAVIFPEGTRSRNGTPKPFQKKGLLTLFNEIPNATILPVTINNSWKLLQYGKFPMGLGVHVKFNVHKPINLKKVDNHEELVQQLQDQISSDIYNAKFTNN